MRRGPLFYVLMVVLVLRGLMGTAMAAGMVPMAMQHPAAAISATAMVHAQAAMPDHGQHDHAAMDHSGHGAEGMPLQQPAQACDGSMHEANGAGCDAHSQHANCTACEICHTALMEPPSLPAGLPRMASGATPTAATPFDSAPAALAIKPPIA